MPNRMLRHLVLPILFATASCAPTETTGTGTAGTNGGAGTSGSAGTTGSAGTSGSAGTTGTGVAGTTGAAGATGSAGTGGSAGTTGTAGTTGSAGASGTGGNAAGTGGSTAGRGGTGGSSAGTGGTGGGAAGRGGTGGSTAGTGGGAAGRGGTGGTAAGGTGGSTSSMGCDVWVAANGSDTAAGSETAPLLTFQKAYDTLCPPPSGATGKVACAATGPNWSVCFKSGTYNFSASMWIKSTRGGTSAHQLKFMAAPNATSRPILDFSGEPRLSAGASPSSADRGVKINADYVLVKGFEVRKANDNGIHIQGANDVVENCVVHDNDDTGIQIGTDVVGSSGINNTVRNCDSYHNYDAVNGGENADGYGMKESSGTGNLFIGCRAWENADDGYDFFAWTSPVKLTDCWASRNARNSSFTGSNSDGNGFKLGGDDKGGNHMLMNCSSWDNKKTGYTNNSGAASSCSGCTSCNNGQADQMVSGISSGGCPTARGMTARNIDGTIP